jgi:hypothetical protein
LIKLGYKFDLRHLIELEATLGATVFPSSLLLLIKLVLNQNSLISGVNFLQQ